MTTFARLLGLLGFVAAGAVAGPPARPLEFPPTEGIHLILPVEAIDGDTVRFYWLIEGRARLWGINAPELHGPDEPAGKAAKEFLAGKLPKWPVEAVAKGREKYGRSLLDLKDAKGRSLSAVLIEAGHAKPYLLDR